MQMQSMQMQMQKMHMQMQMQMQYPVLHTTTVQVPSTLEPIIWTKPKKVKLSNAKQTPKTAEEVEGIEGEDGVDVNLKGPWAAFADPFLGFVNKGSHKEAEARGKRFPTQVMFAWGPQVSRNTAQMITLVSNPLPPCFNRRS